ncbi:pilus assembly protein [Novosphingobium flavum]|uniref:Pilus assembly protein n=1 Tax=Novosphingobium flavum TaxID=1778672 RepID=A0A7X1KMH2_9SPHN|nr:pilus assembly protein [Novosphingobium flavum]
MADPVKRFLSAFWRDCRGAAAVETALVSLLLVTLMAQALDFGWYAYCALQVRMAAQAAVAQAAINCNTAAKLPATTNCSGVTTAMTTAAQQVSLGTGITLGTTAEQYYCRDGNTLRAMGATKPANCSPYSTDTPADFITQTVNYTFAPIFPGLSVVSGYAGVIHSTAWMRLS